MNYQAPSLARLVERMRQINIEIGDNPTAEEAADAINASLADQAVACRCLVDGKPVLLKFCALWSAVFGQKWVYVRQEERVRPASELKGVMK